MGDDTDGVDGVDTDSGFLEPEDSLEYTGVRDVLDEGFSPAERPWAVNDWGTTAGEAAGHESLDRRLAREIPELASAEGDGLGDTTDTDGELYDDEVGEARSGRLVDVEGVGEADDYAYLYARDVGVDGAGASAEEAAVHTVRDPFSQRGY